MKLKGRSILIVALLVLGGFSVYDFYRDKSKAEKSMEESRLLTLNFEQIDSFEVHKDGQKVSVKRNVDGWEVLEPIKDLADSAAVDDFIKGVVPERIIEVASQGPDVKWSVYGLDKPLGTITFVTSSGAKNTFEISERRNFEENVFARRDSENRVLVINSSWQNRVKKAVMDFRDRRFLRNKIAAVDSLRLKNENGILELQRVEGQWRFIQKNDLKIDQNKVRDLLTVIADAKAAEIFTWDKMNLTPKSLFTLELSIDGKKWNADVGQAKDLKIYAKVSEPQYQYRLDAGALDKLIKFKATDLQETAPEEKDKK